MTAAAREAAPAVARAIKDVHELTQRHLTHLRPNEWPAHEPLLEDVADWVDDGAAECLARFKRRSKWVDGKGRTHPIGARARPGCALLIQAMFSTLRTRCTMTGHHEFILPISRPSASKWAAVIGGFPFSERSFSRCMAIIAGSGIGLLYVHGRAKHCGLVAFTDLFDGRRRLGIKALERYEATQEPFWRPLMDSLREDVGDARIIELGARVERREAKLKAAAERKSAFFASSPEQQAELRAERAAAERAKRELQWAEGPSKLALVKPASKRKRRRKAVVADVSPRHFGSRNGPDPGSGLFEIENSEEERGQPEPEGSQKDALRAETPLPETPSASVADLSTPFDDESASNESAAAIFARITTRDIHEELRARRQRERNGDEQAADAERPRLQGTEPRQTAGWLAEGPPSAASTSTTLPTEVRSSCAERNELAENQRTKTARHLRAVPHNTKSTVNRSPRGSLSRLADYLPPQSPIGVGGESRVPPVVDRGFSTPLGSPRGPLPRSAEPQSLHNVVYRTFEVGTDGEDP